MNPIKFRPLRADEIECRVGQSGEKEKVRWCSLLLYKDARVDQKLLDEVVGPYMWQRHHELIDGQLFCTVSIFSEHSGEWVGKQDVGVESNTEKEKGRASDAFKRACFNWGIGRELYTAPFIYITLNEGEWYVKDGKGKLGAGVFFKVKSIAVKNGKITYLVVVDKKNIERYTWGNVEDYFEDAEKRAKEATTHDELLAIYNSCPSDSEHQNRMKRLLGERRKELGI